ncbi:MAG: hypothetical protein JJ863_38130 [Deltaproteobacteria bacterium]|nr:hypothetical protein [Deltaproteobacteria bacterium]
MSHDDSSARSAMDEALGDEVDEVLRDTFYTAPKALTPKKKKKKAAQPDHYKVICISMYLDDLARLDDKVADLKASGHRKMSRSALIRFALDQVDLSKLPPSY